MKIDEVRSSILASVARRQKIANLFLFIALICTLFWVQTSIDAKESFFLHGKGYLVYLLTGLTFILIWISQSKMGLRKSDMFIKFVEKGEIVISESKPLVTKLTGAFFSVIERINLDPQEYSLVAIESKKSNAFATGLSRNKTICIVLKTAEEATDDELEAVMAHEFGHLVNKDLVMNIIRTSLSCCSSVVGDLVGLIVVWIVWGFQAVIPVFLVTSILIPILSGFSSRATEQFADLFATQYGYGRGLISFLSGLPAPKRKILSIFLTHPDNRSRADYIQKYLAGNDGVIKDSTEYYLWMTTKLVVIGGIAWYLWTLGTTVTGFLYAGVLFFANDQLMFNNFGLWHIKDIKRSRVFTVLAYAGIYFIGILACVSFLGHDSPLLSGLSLLTLIFWVAKPITMTLGNKGNDLMAAASEISIYLAIPTSILMMLNYFISF